MHSLPRARVCALTVLASLIATAYAADEAGTTSASPATASSPSSAGIAAAPADAPSPGSTTRTLGVVRVDGAAPTSLPSRIPTTMEGLTGEQIARDVNATDAEDALKYLPSLLVRKRYIGDYNHAVLSTRASGTGNSARSLVYADGILLSNLLGNGATYAPRWGLVSPEEISRVDVMYGPFSAAYSGNAVGAVVDFQTRMPTRFEAHARVGYSQQPKAFLGGDRHYDAKQASASIGSAEGAFSWWLNVGRTDSEGPPQTFANRLISSGAPVVGGKVGGVTAIPVSGAVQALNRSNQPWLMVGSGTQYDTVQDQAKVKLAVDLDPGLRALYVFGLWSNRSDGNSRSFLTDAMGQTIDHRTSGGLSQPVIIDGKGYTLGAGDFPRTRDELEHRMHALSLKRRVRDGLGWELSGSLYDYQSDRSRAYAPTVAKLPDAGRLTDQGGTGWTTLAAKTTWTPEGSDHTIDAGLSQDRYRLRTRVYALDDWRRGAPGAQTSRFDGDTQLQAAFAQDAWAFAPDWSAVLGLRGERWQAFDGITQAGVNTLLHPRRSQTAWSPKAALSYGIGEHWVLKASTGRAVRFPTVSELYQGGFNAKGEAINNNPDLKPERSWTSELSAEWTGAGRDGLRITLFHEDSRDALYAQLNVATNANTVQNIDHIRTRGVELSGTAAVLPRWTVTGSVTFADSVILANAGYATVPGDTVGKWQPRVPRWRATLLTQWQATEALNLSLGARYSGKQFSTLDNSDPNGFAYMSASKYFTVDARAQWKVDRQWTVAAGIDNLNNYQYWNFHPYPGRTFQVEVRWDY
ncbi:MAG: TonB-dependent receptor [Mitsuaria chitosanitabida]|uniref:TonB-dependent receptor n=1 Tax=Roseateles chitosanitabidus TaxID=65048 RepID=UPI001B0BBE24|nr:TonB-dependent receptor [Roseateles chitosanitabidus]MBO9689708.1 TonB-dependent receptor [Roseateles chitosanitabidus]